MSQNLDAILQRLIEHAPIAQKHWEAQEREELGEDEEYGVDGAVWVSLEQSGFGRAAVGNGWWCGYRVRPDEAEEWVLVVSGATPTEAATAMLHEMEAMSRSKDA